MRRGKKKDSLLEMGGARWGVKGNKMVGDEKGEKRKERLYFYGYAGRLRRRETEKA